MLALALVLVPLAWVVERRALIRQSGEVIAVAQATWDMTARGEVLALFGPDADLPPASRREPLRRAVCREEALPTQVPGIEATAVLCLSSDARTRRYFAVGLAWQDAAPVRDWLHRGLDPHFDGMRARLVVPRQGVLLLEETWP